MTVCEYVLVSHLPDEGVPAPPAGLLPLLPLAGGLGRADTGTVQRESSHQTDQPPPRPIEIDLQLVDFVLIE